MDIVRDLVFDHTVRTVALGAAVLGIVAGALGSFAVLRRQSLLGDAMSHAALPGIALAYLFTSSKEPIVLLAGAVAAGWVGTWLVTGVVRTTRVKYDAALGIVLSVFFGFGLVLLTFIQRRPDASQAGLDTFLFGQAAALLERDVVTMAVLGAAVLGVTAALWKELKLLTFDPDFAATLGFRIRTLDAVLTGLLVVAIAVGLQTVGVVLMAAIVVAPAAAARQWTDHLGLMTILAAGFGALAGVAGAVVSSEATRLPTGPTIVLCAAAVVAFSFLFAARRGLVARAVRERRGRRRLRVDAVLADLYELGRQHESFEHAHATDVLAAARSDGASVRGTLAELERRGWARRAGGDWALTDSGRIEAERRRVAQERVL
jgi:manganese/zinc/iron transport system permease protein